MNKIRIEEGIVLNITPSHKINDIEYDQMSVIVKNSNKKESLILLKYKKYDNSFYTVGSRVNCTGNIRSFSRKVESGKNKVDIYVATNFSMDENDFDPSITLYPSSAMIDGSICHMEELRELTSGKCNLHFILANNLYLDANGKEVSENEDYVSRYSSYIPCIAWGKLARRLSKYKIGDKIFINDGELRSREYVKKVNDVEEIKVCHELYIKSYKDV